MTIPVLRRSYCGHSRGFGLLLLAQPRQLQPKVAQQGCRQQQQQQQKLHPTNPGGVGGGLRTISTTITTKMTTTTAKLGSFPLPSYALCGGSSSSSVSSGISSTNIRCDIMKKQNNNSLHVQVRYDTSHYMYHNIRPQRDATPSRSIVWQEYVNHPGPRVAQTPEPHNFRKSLSRFSSELKNTTTSERRISPVNKGTNSNVEMKKPKLRLLSDVLKEYTLGSRVEAQKWIEQGTTLIKTIDAHLVAPI